MCTLSIFPIDQTLIVTMNRDEQRTRKEENNIKITNNLCFPVDAPSQGTWVGMNDSGLVCALLNRYQDKHNPNAPTSRGKIIPEFLQCKNIEQAEEKIKNASFEMFNPFDFLIISAKEFIHASWNGHALTVSKQSTDAPFFISSSSIRTDQILAYRHNIFKNFIQQNDIQKSEILSKLHQHQELERIEDSILVERKATHTKSIVQMTVENNKSEMLYWTEDTLKNRKSISQQQAIQHSFPHCLPAKPTQTRRMAS